MDRSHLLRPFRLRARKDDTKQYQNQAPTSYLLLIADWLRSRGLVAWLDELEVSPPIIADQATR